jgi:hypothetical protein
VPGVVVQGNFVFYSDLRVGALMGVPRELRNVVKKSETLRAQKMPSHKS